MICYFYQQLKGSRKSCFVNILNTNNNLKQEIEERTYILLISFMDSKLGYAFVLLLNFLINFNFAKETGSLESQIKIVWGSVFLQFTLFDQKSSCWKTNFCGHPCF